jgi:hypothetical protein
MKKITKKLSLAKERLMNVTGGYTPGYSVYWGVPCSGHCTLIEACITYRTAGCKDTYMECPL